MNRAAALLLAIALVIIAGSQGLAPLTAQGAESLTAIGDAREALANARVQQRAARLRAERLEAETERAGEASEKALTQVAALAARVEQAEAGVAAAQAQLALVERQRRGLDRDLAERREPLARLAGALQTMAQRPLALAILQPGSLRDVVHTRAVLSGAVPVVRQRTAALRGDLDRISQLEADRSKSLAVRREAGERLEARRLDMMALAEEQRILAARAAGGAAREAARAIELAEEARDLDSLVADFEQRADIRSRLAALDGPIPRPGNPAAAPAPRSGASQQGAGALTEYRLPVVGDVSSGFGEARSDGSRGQAVALIPRPGAQVVAPGEGRIAFAGEYEGYGRIVILEHKGGWTSLVTGLGTLAVTTGQDVRTGSPLGRAPSLDPQIGLELRRGGRSVNPLDRIR